MVGSCVSPIEQAVRIATVAALATQGPFVARHRSLNVINADLEGSGYGCDHLNKVESIKECEDLFANFGWLVVHKKLSRVLSQGGVTALKKTVRCWGTQQNRRVWKF